MNTAELIRECENLVHPKTPEDRIKNQLLPEIYDIHVGKLVEIVKIHRECLIQILETGKGIVLTKRQMRKFADEALTASDKIAKGDG